MRRTSAGIAFLILVLATWAFRGELRVYMTDAFHWMEGLGILGPPVFILIYALLTVFLIPTALLTLAAGLLYGVFWGSLFVLASISGGAVVAFLIGRHGFSESFARYICTHPRLGAVDTELVHEGFKVILLSRLTPFFPGKLSNYFFGVAQFKLRDFFWATLIGTVPFTILCVYAGSLTDDLSQLDPQILARSPFAVVGFIAGAVAALVLISYLTHLVRHALRSSIDNGSNP